MHAFVRQKLGQRFLLRLFENRQIAAVDDLGVHRTRRADQRSEVNVELGSAAGQIEAADRARAHHFEHQIDGRAIHLLGAIRTCVHVTVHARLIACIAEVHLQRVDRAPVDRREIGHSEQRQGGAHEIGSAFRYGAQPRASSRSGAQTANTHRR